LAAAHAHLGVLLGASERGFRVASLGQLERRSESASAHWDQRKVSLVPDRQIARSMPKRGCQWVHSGPSAPCRKDCKRGVVLASVVHCDTFHFGNGENLVL
jgi:hypothetical protein